MCASYSKRTDMGAIAAVFKHNSEYTLFRYPSFTALCRTNFEEYYQNTEANLEKCDSEADKKHWTLVASPKSLSGASNINCARL